MKAFKETEKAVMLEMVLDFVNGEKSEVRKVWFPKSQIRDGKPTKWIVERKIEDALDGIEEICHGVMAFVYDAENELVFG